VNSTYTTGGVIPAVRREDADARAIELNVAMPLGSVAVMVSVNVATTLAVGIVPETDTVPSESGGSVTGLVVEVWIVCMFDGPAVGVAVGLGVGVAVGAMRPGTLVLGPHPTAIAAQTTSNGATANVARE
jgi:hypothetical protein